MRCSPAFASAFVIFHLEVIFDTIFILLWFVLFSLESKVCPLNSRHIGLWYQVAPALGDHCLFILGSSLDESLIVSAYKV